MKVWIMVLNIKNENTGFYAVTRSKPYRINNKDGVKCWCVITPQGALYLDRKIYKPVVAELKYKAVKE